MRSEYMQIECGEIHQSSLGSHVVCSYDKLCQFFFYNLSACVVLIFFTRWYLLICCCSRHQQCFAVMPLGRHGKASGSDGQGRLRTVSEGGGQRKLVGSVHCGMNCQDSAEAGGLLFLQQCSAALHRPGKSRQLGGFRILKSRWYSKLLI